MTVVFAALAALGTAGLGGVLVLGKPMAVVSLGLCGLIVWALVVNDAGGFSRSKHLRRAHEPRHHFNVLEVVFLFGLVLLNLLVVAYVLVSR